MTMINRVIPGDSPKLVFTSDEINLLNGVKYKSSTKHNNIVSEYIKKVAILGGYLGVVCGKVQGTTLRVNDHHL